LSKIKSTPAKVDSEFDMLAQSRSSGDAKSKDADPDLLGQPKEFDEIEEWLKAEKEANEAAGEESLTSKEFDKFLAERAAVADTLPNVKSSDGSQQK
jgi:hypothetical protein